MVLMDSSFEVDFYRLVLVAIEMVTIIFASEMLLLLFFYV